MDDLKKCDFPAVTGLLETVRSINQSVSTEKDTWLTKMNISSMEMLDEAGGAFSEVFRFLNLVTESSRDMQLALMGAGAQAVDANMATMKQCASNYLAR
jgi:hypothetical protein